MPKGKSQKPQTTEEILRDMFIAQLATAGLTQLQIREIVGVDIHRVNRIVKHFRKATQ
jgi:plasmid maintenance system antidote protein VapI